MMKKSYNNKVNLMNLINNFRSLNHNHLMKLLQIKYNKIKNKFSKTINKQISL